MRAVIRALHKIAASARALASDLDDEQQPDAATRARTIARQIEAQAEMLNEGITE